jgi:hypothetical protein
MVSARSLNTWHASATVVQVASLLFGSAAWLYAHQPFCRRALLHDCHFLFVCKPDSHKTLYDWVNLLRPGPDLGTVKLRLKAGSQWHTYTYRWANQVPLAEGPDALKVNWC